MTTNRGGKRQKKVPEKLKDNGFVSESRRCEKWCTILSIEDNKTYTCSTKALGTETCNFVTEADLKQGRELIWTYKGVPYTVELMDVHDEKPMPGAIKRSKRGTNSRYPEDSSDSEDEAHPPRQPPAKKAKITTQAPKNSKPVVECDSDTSSSNGVDSSDEAVTMTVKDKPLLDKQSRPSAVKTAPHTCQDLLQKLLRKVDNLDRKVDLLFKTRPIKEVTGRARDPLTDVKEENSNSELSENAEKYISEKGVKLLSLRALNPEKYALALMDAMFDDEEMAKSCFTGSKRSTKPPLPQQKVALLEDCIDQRFGKGTFSRNAGIITRKCNQKCLDANKRMKNEVKNEVKNTNDTAEDKEN